MVSDEALKKLQEQIAAWPITQRFVVQQLILDYLRNREDLRAYEDTGLTPGDIKELLDMAVSKTDKVLRLKEELHAMKNELCQYCGKYKHAHEGACDGCRWREM
jgi:hypothetical protein|nr:MAG TPA: hypothetical protein [Caudoviricetes sp.]